HSQTVRGLRCRRSSYEGREAQVSRYVNEVAVLDVEVPRPRHSGEGGYCCLGWADDVASYTIRCTRILAHYHRPWNRCAAAENRPWPDGRDRSYRVVEARHTASRSRSDSGGRRARADVSEGRGD